MSTGREAGDVGEVAAIKAQNPHIETARRTIAWWEQACDYWRSEAQKGYDLRDSLAAREQAARAEAEADRDHWKAHAEEAGEGFSRVCKDYARVAARNSELVRRAEAAEEKVARIEALLAGYDAWTGADPFGEFASSPKQRDQLRKALDGGE